MPNRQTGFTLVELAISFLIIALLLGGALMTLGAQNDVRATADTQRTLQQAQEALVGFAASQGRIPCPATAASSGLEAPVGGGACTAAVGFYPAVTLGIGPANQGLLVDAWGNPIRYAVTTANANAFTTAGQMRTLGATALTSDLQVCRDSACAAAGVLTKNAVALIFSTGKNFPTINAGDEAENIDPDSIFVSHTPDPNFDDIVTWLSPYTLYNRMIAAGAL
jgi:type II secretory pathway pseudopilin PulG